MNEQVASLYADIAVRMQGALRGLREFRTRLGQSQAGLKTLRDQSRITGAAISTGITAVMGVLGSKAITAFGDAERAMNVFKLATHATGAEMDQARAAIEGIAHDLTLPGITRADAANALMALGNAGLSARDAIAALRPALLLAEAGEITGARAAEILAAALASFSLPGSEAARVVDLLAGAALAATGSVSDHAEAVRVAGPVWAAAHVPIETLVTAIAELAKNGTVGANAGEQLKTVMLRLINPTEEARGLMAAMGVHVYDAAGRMKDFRTIIGDFQRGLAPLTDAQKNQRLATIFGSEAVSAAAIIFQKEGIPGFDQMKEAVTRSGTAQELATAKTQGLSGATDGLAKALDTASVDAVKPFEEDIRNLARALTQAVVWFDGLDDGTKKLVVGAGGLLLVLAPLGYVLTGIGAAVGGVLTGFGWLLAAVDGMGVAVAFLATNPLGLLILALGGLVAVLVWAYANVAAFRDVVDTAFARIRDVARGLEGAVDGLNDGFRRLTGARVDFGQIFQGIPIIREIMGIWENLKRLGIVGGGGSVGGGFGPTIGPTPVVNVGGGGGAQGFVGGVPIPNRASGGAVAAGQPYWVGERGVPELFVPGRSGTVVAGAAGGGGTVAVNFYGQVFGFADVKDMIVRAIDEARREGRVNA